MHSVRPLSGSVGAELRGIRLAPDMAPHLVQAVAHEVRRWRVVFLRDQSHLDDAAFEAVSRLFGDPEPHPTVPSIAGTAIVEIDGAIPGRDTLWHTDMSYLLAYPCTSILRALTVSDVGGDSTWADCIGTYAALPPALRAFADTAWTMHSNAFDLEALNPDATPAALARHAAVFSSEVFETEHPLVRRHPETGEPSLLLGHFARRILGCTEWESTQLLAMLQRRATEPERTVRWSWRAGDVSFADNSATMHRAVDDWGDAPRRLQRITLRGVVPCGVDGRRSTARARRR